MKSATATLTINAAFFQEIKDDNVALWKLLDEITEALPENGEPGVSPREMALLLGQLRDQLAMHFALEEAYGYFEDPVLAAPRLSRQAENLRTEHRELFLEVCNVADGAEKVLHGKHSLRAAREVIGLYHAFRLKLTEHERQETDLILSAYDDDIGVGD